METRKIAVACFIGGILCAGLALILAPNYWFIGLLAGFAGGYLSYEFKEVPKAITSAWHATYQDTSGKMRESRNWLSEKHPFLYFAAALTYLPTIILPIYLTTDLMDHIILTMLMSFVATFFVSLLLFALAYIGARAGERCYWLPIEACLTVDGPNMIQRLEVEKLQGRGYKEKPLTYFNVLRWMANGLGIVILFFLWTIWKYLAIAAWLAIRFLGRFGWHLFKLIHSKERVLCAIDGTIGGAISFACLYGSSTSSAGKLLLVFFGGLLGAGLGVANWELVSKRLLHIQTAGN